MRSYVLMDFVAKNTVFLKNGKIIVVGLGKVSHFCKLKEKDKLKKHTL